MKLFACLLFGLLVVMVMGQHIVNAASHHNSFFEPICLQDVSYANLAANSTVIGVKSFMTAFVWREVWDQLLMAANTTTSPPNASILSRYDFFTAVNQSSTGVVLSIGVEKSSLPLFNQLIQYLHIDTSKMAISRIFLTDELCRTGNVFEDFDVLFLEPYRFTHFLRLYREQQSGKRITTLRNGAYINGANFYPIPILPSNFTVWNEKVCGSVMVDLSRSLLNNLTSVGSILFNVGNYSCSSSPDLYDNQVLRMLHRYSNFSEQDISLVSALKSIPLQSSWDLVNLLFPSTELDQLLNMTIMTPSTIQVTQSLLPSSCHFCSATLCPEYHVNDQHYWAIGENGIIIIYFIALFASGSFKSPTFLRRLCVPYLPILCFLIMIFFSRNVGSFCYSAFHYVSVLLCFWFVTCYVMTVLRFFYLKNLYRIVNRSKRIKFHKIMASSGMGLFLTGFMSLVVSVVLSSFSTAMFVIDPDVIGLFRNICLLLCIVMGSLLGLGAVLMDAIVNRKNIRNHGIMKFLMFDDPFYVRIDLISMFALLILGLLIVVVSVVPAIPANATRSLNTLFSIATTLICGGNALILEAIKKIFFNIKSTPISFTLDNLLLTNKEFYELFAEYCEKEFSKENLLLWEKLRVASADFKKEESTVSMEFLQELDQEFFSPYSKYEVNVPSSVRKEFQALIKNHGESSSEELLQIVTVKHLMDIVYRDVLLNMSDTLSRLQKTAQYKSWEEVFSLQKSQNILE